MQLVMDWGEGSSKKKEKDYIVIKRSRGKQNMRIKLAWGIEGKVKQEIQGETTDIKSPFKSHMKIIRKHLYIRKEFKGNVNVSNI